MSNADALFQRAGQLMQSGQVPQAAAVLQQLVNEQPQHYKALCALAQIALQSNRSDIAQSYASRAADANPEGFEALALLAPAAQANGEIAIAVDAMTRIAALRPDDDRVHFNLGVLQEQSNAPERAIAHYEDALAQNPAHLEARANLCMLLLERNDDAALAHIAEIVRRKRSIDADDHTALSPEESITSAFKLQMDLEQFRYLRDRSLLDAEHAEVIETLESVLEDLSGFDPLEPFAVKHPRHHWKPHWQKLETFHNRAVYLPKPKLPDGPLINPDLDRESIEARYYASRPQYVVVDDLLAPAALEALLEFCQTATIWFDPRRNYLGAYLTEGFGNALTIGIARGLAEALPGIFSGHALTQAWGYKYGAALTGIGMHADAAAVNCNFWIAPNEANLDPEHGGLRIFKSEAPLDWDFQTFNNDEDAMREHLGARLHDPIVVPHRQNRMVIFNSNLIHQTDRIEFRDAFESRRYNITLLYGRRGKQ